MSAFDRLIQRVRYCRNTGEPFIWDQSFITEAETEVIVLRNEAREMIKSLKEAKSLMQDAIDQGDQDAKNWMERYEKL